MPSEKSKYFVDSDLVIDSQNRIIYYPNGLRKTGYIMPDIDSVIRFRRFGYTMQWAPLFLWIIFMILFYLRVPILIILLLSPLYYGALFLIRHIKIKRPLRRYEISDEVIEMSNNWNSILGSMSEVLLWAFETFFLIFVFLGLYALVYKPEQRLGGLILIILSGAIAAFILYVIYLKYRIRARIRPSK